MLEGGFSVQLGEWKLSGSIPTDQTMDDTMNKDTMTAGTFNILILKQARLIKTTYIL